MDQKELNENEKLLILIDKMLKENPGTNFDRCFPQHFNIFIKYVDAARKKQLGCFPDKETYQAFSSAKLFFDKFKYVVFQKDGDTQNIEIEDHLPTFETFHRTDDEIEMMKNRILKGINKGDILHLKIIEENAENWILQILNKYGDTQRILDCKLSAFLLKQNVIVQNIKPPLQIGDLIRAAVFTNVKQEEGQFKKLIISLNPIYVNNEELKHLYLGRVCKKDIPNYPEDISKFKSVGEYIRANTKFDDPQSILKQITSFGCDPLKTGPLYETRYKRQATDDYDRLLAQAALKLSITCDKTRKAAVLLKNGQPLNAFLEIEGALQSYPDNDLALTIRGKIYLALSAGKPSRKVKKAFLDFEAALKINEFNEEAAEFRESILLESQQSFIKKNMPEKAKRIEKLLKKQPFSAATEAFLKSIKEKKEPGEKASFLVKTGASSSQPVPVIPKDEPMDV